MYGSTHVPMYPCTHGTAGCSRSSVRPDRTPRSQHRRRRRSGRRDGRTSSEMMRCRRSRRAQHTGSTSAGDVFFLQISRSMPTANAEDPCRYQGASRRASPRPFRCRSPTRSGRRRSPSACAEKLSKNRKVVQLLSQGSVHRKCVSRLMVYRRAHRQASV